MGKWNYQYSFEIITTNQYDASLIKWAIDLVKNAIIRKFNATFSDSTKFHFSHSLRN